MPVCGYIVMPSPGAAEEVRNRLRALDGCAVVPALNRELLLLVTDTPDLESEARLEREIGRIDGILSRVLTFGDLDGASAPAAILPRRAPEHAP